MITNITGCKDMAFHSIDKALYNIIELSLLKDGVFPVFWTQYRNP